MNKLLKAFTRTKHLTSKDVEETPLKRVLSTLDLTALGVGGTLGAGVYVVTGEVAKLKAGPAIVISFTIAAVASILSGLCYAEFGARVPRAGSAYIYSYVTIGELCAFVIGWNIVLEYIVSASSVARAWSGFFDSLFDHRIQNFTVSTLGEIKVPGLSEYPDFLAFTFILVITTILVSGAQQSSILNWVFTSINLFVILFATISGFVFADTKNWSDFMPYGFASVISGAATCFYCFVGFDIIATSAEEAKTPSKSIPRAIIVSLLICYVAYFGVSAALTLMFPYYMLDETTALATAFEKRGFPVGKYVVAVGAICGLSSSAIGGLFPLPRILYAMASDGVIFRVFARVSPRTGTPYIACLFSGILTSLLALFLDLVSLVEMLSIGTLLAYTIVAFCVLLLRYKPGSLGIVVPSNPLSPDKRIDTKTNEASTTDNNTESEDTKVYEDTKTSETKGLLDSENNDKPWFSNLSKLLVGGPHKEPTEESYIFVKILLALFVAFAIALQNVLIWGSHYIVAKDPVYIILVVLLAFVLFVITEIIGVQPQSKNELPFKVPLVPIVPLLAIFINMTLIFMLSYLTWIRFVVWMAIGMSIYIFYGLKHSNENKENTRNHSEYLELSTLSDNDKEK